MTCLLSKRVHERHVIERAKVLTTFGLRVNFISTISLPPLLVKNFVNVNMAGNAYTVTTGKGTVRYCIVKVLRC